MCIIISTPKRGLVKPSWIDESWRCNRDGGGVAYPLNGLVEIRSGLMTLPDFKAQVEAIPEDIPAILHFRIATSGGVNPKNTHPWRINERVAMAHNGILTYPHREPFSDTGSFVHDVLRPMFEKDPDALRSDYFARWLANYLGSCNSMSFIDGAGKIYNIVGDGNRSPQTDGGVWFSNSTYMPFTTRQWKGDTPTKTKGSPLCKSRRRLFTQLHDASRSSSDGLVRRPITTVGAYHHRYATHAQDRRFLSTAVRDAALKDMFHPGAPLDTTDVLLLGVGITLNARLCDVHGLLKDMSVLLKHQASSDLLIRERPLTAMSPDYLNMTGTDLSESHRMLYLSAPSPQDDPRFHIYSGASLTMLTMFYHSRQERGATIIFRHHNERALKSKTINHKRACSIYNQATAKKHTSYLAGAFDFTAKANCCFVGDEDHLRRRRYLAWDKDCGVQFEFGMADGLLTCAAGQGVEIGYIQLKGADGGKFLIEPGAKLIEMMNGRRVPGDDFTFVCEDAADFTDNVDSMLSLIAKDSGIVADGDLFFEYYAFIEQQDFLGPDDTLVEVPELNKYEIYRRIPRPKKSEEIGDLFHIDGVSILDTGVANSAGDLVVSGYSDAEPDVSTSLHCPFDTLMWYMEWPQLDL